MQQERQNMNVNALKMIQDLKFALHQLTAHMQQKRLNKNVHALMMIHEMIVQNIKKIWIKKIQLKNLIFLGGRYFQLCFLLLLWQQSSYAAAIMIVVQVVLMDVLNVKLNAH
ncbi:MAG: hypothetical protein EZS28_009186 [Streblomastix strix]|uniref:Transmembrane protein n=1 Tax=Streblomastix strix TaxID=222440 RepID=A0A5J4WKZ1_9EUKA|nr:MAG: hypothetical protein EZS28_009186 [Streblomastix strix]